MRLWSLLHIFNKVSEKNMSSGKEYIIWKQKEKSGSISIQKVGDLKKKNLCFYVSNNKKKN